jgi:hypothetical protein
MTLDPNDFEDAVICSNLDPAGRWLLVTQDKTMCDIINRIGTRLRLVSSSCRTAPCCFLAGLLT